MGWGRPGHYLLVATALAAAALVGRLAPRLGRVEVRGDSMRPALVPGDRLVVLRTRRLHPGHLVALVDPRAAGRLVVKRVATASRHEVTVLGDNASASTDSRHYGAVPTTAVRGRAIYRYAPEPRRGRL